MAEKIFNVKNATVTWLIDQIEKGYIALPEIQRPFVWPNSSVRNLFDSMHKGFPVGYLLLWATAANDGAKQIGTDDKQSVASQLIVDGQQRLTSLYAVIKGHKILTKDYKEEQIRLAFRPADAKFEVLDAAIENDPEFIPDISVVYKKNFLELYEDFIEQLEEHRGVPVTKKEKKVIHKNLDDLKDIDVYDFQIIELHENIDEEEVAEIFVRINSQGAQLNNADFILTLMSVFWEKGRRELEEFSKDAKIPASNVPSPFNHFIKPSPDQLLRTSVGLAFRRGRLQYIYSILRGKDLETGEFSPERRESQFDKLREAHEATLDLTHWHEFLKCLQHAGFRSERMVSSETALMYVYIFWLLGRLEYEVESKQLREVIARWWFMSHTTGRYTGSSETQIEADFNRLNEIKVGDAEGFCNLLDQIISDTFTNDYWEITFPNRLDTSAAKSPPLSAYWAALNILDAEMLFSDLKISSMLDPLVTPLKDMERHHLFPKAYLRQLKITTPRETNTIANMSFVDWADNLKISDTSPSEYWSAMTKDMKESQLEKQVELHALPKGWENLEYSDFCDKRRKLISKVVKKGFDRLCEEIDQPENSTLVELIDRGESNILEFKESARWSHGTSDKGKSEQVITKTIAGFMNVEGGTLLIGVNDKGDVVGLQPDYDTLSKPNRDGYELFLTQLISDKISINSAMLCRITFEQIESKDICRIDVAASPKPAFACSLGSKNPTDFWVRLGNKTDQMRGPDQADYIKQHWG